MRAAGRVPYLLILLTFSAWLSLALQPDAQAPKHQLYKRLDDDERLALRPGHIYVWEERSNNPLEANSLESIQRFTDGRSWGPSKAREYV